MNSTEEPRRPPWGHQWDTNSLRLTDEQWGSNPKRKGSLKNASAATLRIQAPSKTSSKMTRRSVSKMSNGRTTLEYKKECAQKKLPYVNYMRRLGVGCPMTWQKYASQNQRTNAMCNGSGSLEEQWWIDDKHQVTKWGEWLWTPKMEMWPWMSYWSKGLDAELAW